MARKFKIYRTKPSMGLFAPVDVARNYQQAQRIARSYPTDYKRGLLIHKEKGVPRGGLLYTFYIRKGTPGTGY